MGGFFAVLPLAFVMIAGPQIISAVFLATSEGWGRNCAAYVFGAAVGITATVTVAFFVISGLKSGSGKSTGSEGDTLDLVLLGLLLVLMLRVFLTRKTSKPPSWMGKLQQATPRFALLLGLALLSVFPTDIITSTTVGIKIAREGEPWSHTLGFVGVTLLLLAFPALLVLVLGARGRTLLPKVRDWMNANSWIISELVLLLFVGLELSNLLG